MCSPTPQVTRHYCTNACPALHNLKQRIDGNQLGAATPYGTLIAPGAVDGPSSFVGIGKTKVMAREGPVRPRIPELVSGAWVRLYGSVPPQVGRKKEVCETERSFPTCFTPVFAKRGTWEACGCHG